MPPFGVYPSPILQFESTVNEPSLLEESEHKLNLRHLRLEDYPDLKEIMDAVYPEFGGAWPEKKLKAAGWKICLIIPWEPPLDSERLPTKPTGTFWSIKRKRKPLG